MVADYLYHPVQPPSPSKRPPVPRLFQGPFGRSRRIRARTDQIHPSESGASQRQTEADSRGPQAGTFALQVEQPPCVCGDHQGVIGPFVVVLGLAQLLRSDQARSQDRIRSSDRADVRACGSLALGPSSRWIGVRWREGVAKGVPFDFGINRRRPDSLGQARGSGHGITSGPPACGTRTRSTNQDVVAGTPGRAAYDGCGQVLLDTDTALVFIKRSNAWKKGRRATTRLPIIYAL